MFVHVQIHALLPLYLATLTAVQMDSIEMLNVVCEFPNESFKADSLQLALAMAVEKDSALNVAQLAKGAYKLPSIDETLIHAKEIHAFGVYTVLLMLQAAYADDSQVVRALFGKEESIAVPVISDQEFPLSHIQSVLHDDQFPIEVILEVAHQLGSVAFATALESTSMIKYLNSGCHDGKAKAQYFPSRNETDNIGTPRKKENSGALAALRSQGQPPSRTVYVQYLLYVGVMLT